MADPMEAVYEVAYEAFKRAPLGSSIVRACVDAVWPLAVAEGRRQAVEAIRARVGDIAAVEWAALIVEEEGRG